MADVELFVITTVGFGAWFGLDLRGLGPGDDLQRTVAALDDEEFAVLGEDRAGTRHRA